MAEQKIIDKIRKLFALAEKNPNEQEAMSASLKAQELMAQYHVDSSMLDEEITDKKIAEMESYVGTGSKWKYRLANIIAKNFCCKVYVRNKDTIIFYGFERDAEIARNTFNFLFKIGNKLADRMYRKVVSECRPAGGVRNDYLIGFTNGIEEVLGKQCVALMLVTPEEVNEGWKVKSAHMGGTRVNMVCSGDARIREQGRVDGISTAQARYIEGG